MPPRFGTSGLRGLVTELTPALVAAHVTAFARACPTGSGLYVARDLRPSSPALAAVVVQAAQALGLAVTDCGALPTPALALAAMRAGAAAVMVTGSHIPADRNGLKFYTPLGEITKDHEAALLAALGGDAAPDHAGPDHAGPEPVANHHAGADYIARYVTAFGGRALAGLRLGVYSHSAVGRDLLLDVLAALGAGVVELGRSDVFVPVDTEAVDPATRAQLAAWAVEMAPLDAILSTDRDGDRPLMADATGRVIPGDVLGQITAAALGADVVVTPVSSNSGVAVPGRFARVIRTRIGSPHVIAAMEAAQMGEAAQAGKAAGRKQAGQEHQLQAARVAGYEANGGFLLGFDATGPAGPLPALMTRDSLLPLIAPLVAMRAHGSLAHGSLAHGSLAHGSLAALVAAEPARFTASDRLPDVSTDRSAALVAHLGADAQARAAFLALLGGAGAALDVTDGLRLTLEGGRVLHLRPSGNAPELRIYTEAASPAEACALLAAGLAALAAQLG